MEDCSCATGDALPFAETQKCQGAYIPPYFTKVTLGFMWKYNSPALLSPVKTETDLHSRAPLQYQAEANNLL